MKDNIQIFDNIPKSYYNSIIGKGRNSKCYLIENTMMVYKEYFYNGLYIDVDKIKKLVGVLVDGFELPKSIICISSDNGKFKIKGHTLNFVEGKTLTQCQKYLLLEDYINMLYKYNDNLKELTKKSIYVYDITDDNTIITNNNSLVTIDVDMFDVLPGVIDYNQNIRRYNIGLMYSFFCYGPINNTIPIKIDGKNINKYFKDFCIKGTLTPDILISVYKEYFEKISGNRIKTLEDFIKASEISSIRYDSYQKQKNIKI